MYSVEPSDFLEMNGDPKVTLVFSGKSINPNGLYPARDGSLLMVGYQSKTEPRAIYAMAPGKNPKALSKDIGLLDGVYQTRDGVLLVTDWVSGSLFSWSAKTGMNTLASGFKGPADFCAYDNDDRAGHPALTPTGRDAAVEISRRLMPWAQDHGHWTMVTPWRSWR